MLTHHKADAVAAVDQNVMGLDVSPADQRRIDEENKQLVKSMSPAEVEEARLELMSRLSPSAQAFLAKRAAGTLQCLKLPQSGISQPPLKKCLPLLELITPQQNGLPQLAKNLNQHPMASQEMQAKQARQSNLAQLAKQAN